MKRNLFGWYLVRWFDTEGEYNQMRFDDYKEAISFMKKLKQEGCHIMRDYE